MWCMEIEIFKIYVVFIDILYRRIIPQNIFKTEISLDIRDSLTKIQWKKFGL